MTAGKNSRVCKYQRQSTLDCRYITLFYVTFCIRESSSKFFFPDTILGI
jgi:hypothetical protein